MRYKDYVAVIHYYSHLRKFFGVVAGGLERISFEGTSVNELEANFHKAVDAYLERCKERNIEPLKQFSGIFNLRIPPDLHQALFWKANALGTSLNELVLVELTKSVGE